MCIMQQASLWLPSLGVHCIAFGGTNAQCTSVRVCAQTQAHKNTHADILTMRSSSHLMWAKARDSGTFCSTAVCTAALSEEMANTGQSGHAFALIVCEETVGDREPSTSIIDDVMQPEQLAAKTLGVKSPADD